MIDNFDNPMLGGALNLPNITPSGDLSSGGAAPFDALLGEIPRIADADANGAGLSFDAFASAAPGKVDAEALFASIDADGDGALSAAERDAFAAAMQDKIAAKISDAMGAFGGLGGGEAFDLVSQMLEATQSGSDEQDEAQDAASLNGLTSRLAEQAYAKVAAMVAA